MHRALQFIRPLLVAVQGDVTEDAWRRSKATFALSACDTAMITADMDYPTHDFYAENIQTEGTAESGPSNPVNTHE
jgi:hypothetical protein